MATRQRERQRLHNIAIVGDCSFSYLTEKLRLENLPPSRANSHIAARSGSRMAPSGRRPTDQGERPAAPRPTEEEAMNRPVRSTAGLGGRLMGPPHGDQERAGNTAAGMTEGPRRTRCVPACPQAVAKAIASVRRAREGAGKPLAQGCGSTGTLESLREPTSGETRLAQPSTPPLLAEGTQRTLSQRSCMTNEDVSRPDA